MTPFKDTKGQEWQIAVTVDTVRRVRDLCKFDLTDLGASMAKLSADPVLMGDVLFAVIKPQADKGNITPEEFFKLLDGDAVETAFDALMEEAINFFGSRRRKALREIKATSDKAAQIVIDKTMLKIPSPERLADDLLAELEKTATDRANGRITTPSAGNLPASSASTPDHSPSGN